MKSGRYELIGDWETSSAGQMAYATYNGKKYFLKKYCIIKKPELDGSTSEKVYAKRKKKYDEFKSNREQINKTLLEFTNLGGNTICPRHWYEVPHRRYLRWSSTIRYPAFCLKANGPS